MQYVMDIEKASLPQELKGNYVGKAKRLQALQTAVFRTAIATTLIQTLYRIDMQWSVTAEWI